jgi:ribosomal protein L40E
LGNGLAADVCVVIIVLIVILIIVGIILRFITWGSKVAANIGQYRQGTAVKQIAQKGLTLDQRHTAPGYTPFGSPSGQPTFCPFCGAPLPPGALSCRTCGRSFASPFQSALPPQTVATPSGPVCVSCKKAFEGGDYCNWCGAKQRETCSICGADNPANAPFCRKCGTPSKRERKLKELA